MAKKENKFQKELKYKIQKRFPDCIVMKNNAFEIQGIPDLLILYKDKWAALECKRSARAKHRPNQDYWVDKLNELSFSAFIYPENKQEVIDEMVGFFKGIPTRKSHAI